MNKKPRFLKSLQYAIQGIVYCILQERNMRIHTVVALYVFVFSFFFQLSRVEYAVLFLTFALVMAAEAVNTAMERLCDMKETSFSPWVRVIKDTAAGAVLVCAVFAVAVGVCLFWQPDILWSVWLFITGCWWRMLVLLLSFLCAWIYVQLGPSGIWRKLTRKQR
jgi:diacylglycerol kinase